MSSDVLGDAAMATNFWLSMGYNFGCVIASDTLFDSRGGFMGHAIRYPVGQISRNLHKKTCFRVLCEAFGKHL